MGLQVASLSAGSGTVTPAQQVKSPGLSEEQRSQVEASLPGNEKAKPPDLAQTTADLEQISLAFNRRLQFVIDHVSDEILIKVIDNETDKVIRVLPPEELRRLHSRIRETLGFLFDSTV